MPERLFVHVLGRSIVYDHLKQGLKQVLPFGVVRAYRRLTRPWHQFRAARETRRAIRTRLSPELQQSFERMLTEARHRWDQGIRDLSGEVVTLPIPGTEYTVSARRGSCDIILYSDIFLMRNYGQVPKGLPVKVIIDCGANIGFASAFFLSQCPDCRVIALEPDPVNYELCCANLRQFGDRASVLRVGLCDKPMSLSVNPQNLGTWASTISPVFDKASAGEVVEGWDVPTLLDRCHIDRVDVMKIDIEGAELPVFTAQNLGWIQRVRCFLIEPEDDACEKAFVDALGSGWEFTRYREIVMAVRKAETRN